MHKDARPQALIGCTPSGSIRCNNWHYDVAGLVYDAGNLGLETALTGTSLRPGSQSPGGSDGGRARSAPPAIIVGPVACRRDDHAFLPAGARAGLPCDTTTTGNTTDPRQFAKAMFGDLNMPSLRLGMNPHLGMVALPTWFWVEGYDGGVIPLSNNLVLTHEECRRVADRDAAACRALDADGTPRTRRECRIIVDTLTVEVRAWPRTFGVELRATTGVSLSTCPDTAACPAGIGLPFTDSHSLRRQSRTRIAGARWA